MKMRLLTALVVTGCFSQMAMADLVTTGTIDNKTTTTATVTLNQPITLENTLTPVEGLKAGTSISTLASGLIANGNLNIKETGATAQLALKSSDSGGNNFVTYATGHADDSDYKLEYRPYLPVSLSDDYIVAADGTYLFSKNNINNVSYTVSAVGSKLPKAGNYVISVTGAIYTP
ncbi:hypothetical protein [Pantoea ananatis]|jgi:hypothetical protein|uniref:hypothetical protein n=1 Tax=Pantoea ananas TaxID=553 RepID=UPI0015761973|nr:hypothetical protein [Pantoea ananatis]NQE77579.1 hypothetical protein [Pantoea ananatis]NQE82123.1 hypothetical protein [Pantoea ananatis]